MEPNEEFEDDFENSVGTVVIAFRDSPALKEELDNERIERGENYSSYLRGIVRDRHASKEKVAQLTLQVSEQQKEIERLNAQAVADAKQFEVAAAEIVQLRKKLEEQNNQLTIYNDKRLLYLFDHLKDKRDTVENAYGDNFSITYQTPEQVLQALVYSTKLNK